MKEHDLITEDALEISQLPNDILKEYGLSETTAKAKRAKDTSIYSFQEIGWIDPFPKLPPPQLAETSKLARKGTKIKPQKFEEDQLSYELSPKM